MKPFLALKRLRCVVVLVFGVRVVVNNLSNSSEHNFLLHAGRIMLYLILNIRRN